ncbi:MAG: amino acid permease, partial [Planctomycetota bacterium]|nr:amino acid permease [Planctomycetota bacterium]
PQPQRRFGLPTAACVVVASMVGVGILTTSGYIIRDTSSHVTMLILWLVGGFLALCGSLSVAELAAAMPRTGGEYVFVREAYGDAAAFLYGWVSLVIGFSAPVAAVAHGAASYLLAPWFGGGDASVAACGLAALFIVVISGAHLRGATVSSWTQNLSTLLKLIPLFLLVAAGFALGRGSIANIESGSPPGETPWPAMGIALVYIMYSYSGWNAAVYLAGEVREPGRILPRALLLGCSGVIALYMFLNLLYAYAIPVADIVTMPASQVEPIAALAANRLFGEWIAAPFSLCIGLGLLANVSAYMLIGPRVYYAMARDRLFPASAARLNPATGAPSVAIFVQTACALLLLFSGTFKDILTYMGVGLSVSSFFVVLAVFVLRFRRPDMPRPFRMIGYPVTPLLFLTGTLWMIVFAFQSQPLWSCISVGTILCGLPVFWTWKKFVAAREMTI